jgi:hypothetical protein
MSGQKVRNGSFRVRVPVGNTSSVTMLDQDGAYSVYPNDYEQKDTVNHTVQMLSQNEYANGWRQVVPKKRIYIKRFKDDNGMEHSKISSNVFRMNVNLAQLPHHLWHCMRNNSFYISEGMYSYNVERTDIDSDIRELVQYTTQPYNSANRDRVRCLIDTMKENDIYGWATIKASAIYHH